MAAADKSIGGMASCNVCVFVCTNNHHARAHANNTTVRMPNVHALEADGSGVVLGSCIRNDAFGLSVGMCASADESMGACVCVCTRERAKEASQSIVKCTRMLMQQPSRVHSC